MVQSGPRAFLPSDAARRRPPTPPVTPARAFPRSAPFLVAALTCFSLDNAHSQTGPNPQSGSLRSESLPTSGMLGFEMIRLPQGERMGLVGGSLLFDIGGDWGVGPAVYGAATGKRGGFFVGGVELQRRWDLGRGFSLATGLYAGGGGGAGAPVGGGLMLRPALTVLKDLGSSLQAGLSLSSVRFPNGDIQGTQLGLTLAWRSEFIHFSSGDASITGDGPTGPSTLAPHLFSSRAAGLGFDRMAVTATTYKLTGGGDQRIRLGGARAERRSGLDGFVWGIEATAAAQGSSAGYMELLGTTSFSKAPLADFAPAWRIGVRLSGGVAGGGSVPTGGGLIGKASATTEWSPVPGWTLGAEYGLVRSRSTFRARLAQVWLAVDLEPGLDQRSGPDAHLVRTEWVGALQHHPRELRADGTRRSLDTVGLKLNRYFGDHFYLSGQAHSAFAGGAGAYSVGLVGAGIATRAPARWRAGAELLVGAAGGGGVQTSGGGVAQGLLWTAWSPSPISEWRVGVGSMRPLHGGNGNSGTQGSPVIELSWSRSFGMAGH